MLAASGALRLGLRLDVLAVAALVASVVVTGGRGRDDDVGFLGDPLPDGLAVLAFAAALAAGVVAAWALVHEPPRTRAARWALGLAIAFVASFPVLALLTVALGLEHGWAEPVVRPALLLATGLGAMVLGAVAREPGRRGLLLVPLLIGEGALTFIVGDLLDLQ
jgi:hypothetical protein